MTDNAYGPPKAQIEDVQPAQTPSAGRPTSITVICIIGLLGALAAVPLVFSPMAASIGRWYPPSLAVSALVGGACMIGLWFMRKWAAYLYTGFAAFNQIVMLIMGVWSPLALLIPAVVIFFALKHVRQMS